MKKKIIFLLSMLFVLLTLGCGDESSNDDNVINGDGTEIEFENESHGSLTVYIGEGSEFCHIIEVDDDWSYEPTNEMIQASWDEDLKGYYLTCIFEGKYVMNRTEKIKLEIGSEVEYKIIQNASALKVKNNYESKSIVSVMYESTSSKEWKEAKFSTPLRSYETAFVKVPGGTYNMYLKCDDGTNSIEHEQTLFDGNEVDYDFPSTWSVRNETNAPITYTIEEKYVMEIEAQTEKKCEYYPGDDGNIHIKYSGLLVLTKEYDTYVGQGGNSATYVDSNTGAIRINNNSNTAIKEVYVVSYYSDYWGENISDGMINPDESFVYQVEPKEYYIKVVDENNIETEFLNQVTNYNEITEISFTGK